MENIKTSIGENIRKMRQMRGLKQDVIAQKLGLTQTAYSDIENNKTDISLSRLTQIAEALGVNLVDLINFDDKKVFYNHNQNGGNAGNSIFVTETVKSSEKELYERIIKQLEEENKYLKTLLDVFKGKN